MGATMWVTLSRVRGGTMGPSRRFAVLLAFLIVAITLTARSAWAAPSISLKPKVGPPTSKAKVSGAGFAPGEKVDIYFDVNKVGSSTAGTRGGLSQSISVPGPPPPGA